MDITSRNAAAIWRSLVSNGSRGSVRITPCARTRCLRPSLSMTPQPVRSVPQSMPSTRTGFPALLRQGLHLGFIDVEVGIDVLHVFIFFQRFTQPEHAAGVLAFQ